MYIYITKRQVFCQDAVEWLSESIEPFEKGSSIFTSLPDISELEATLFKNLSTSDLDPISALTERVKVYEEWFINVSALILSRLPYHSYAIFLQSPVRVIIREGKKKEQVIHNDNEESLDQSQSDLNISKNKVVKYIDKSHLLATAAKKANCVLMWKKITLNSVLEKRSYHRPTYSDLICFGKGEPEADDSKYTAPPKYNAEDFGVPDVITRGEMLWAKGVGIDAAILGINFLKYIGKSSLIIDPFCGVGTILAVANYYGMDSFGVELSPKRSKQSLLKDVEEEITRIPTTRLKLLGVKFPLKSIVKGGTGKELKNSSHINKINLNKNQEKDIEVNPEEEGSHEKRNELKGIVPTFLQEVRLHVNTLLRFTIYLIFFLVIIYC